MGNNGKGTKMTSQTVKMMLAAGLCAAGMNAAVFAADNNPAQKPEAVGDITPRATAPHNDANATNWLWPTHKEKFGFLPWSNALYYKNGLFYLYTEGGTAEAQKNGGNFDAVVLSTSRDGVFWEDRGVAWQNRKGKATSNGIFIAADGRYVMIPNDNLLHGGFLGTRPKRPDGTYDSNYLIVSTDLLKWTRLDANYDSYPDPRWYAITARWDGPFIFKEGDAYYGYLVARGKNDRFGETMGLVRSKDGLHWEAQPPVVVEGTTSNEPASTIKIGDTFYLTTDIHWSRMCSRILVSKNVAGPFAVPTKNHVLALNIPWMRFFKVGDEVLVSSYMRWWWVPFKPAVTTLLLHKAVVDDEGTMRIKWWNGNDKLKGEPVASGKQSPLKWPGTVNAGFGKPLDVEQGFVIEGTVTIPSQGLDDNLALKVPVKASSEKKDRAPAAGLAEYAVDGRSWVFWLSNGKQLPPGEKSFSIPEWLELDLGSEKKVDSVRIDWTSSLAGGVPADRCSVAVSRDDQHWETVAQGDRKGVLHTEPGSDTFHHLGKTARYVRVDMASGTREENPFAGYGIDELSVFPETRSFQTGMLGLPALYLECQGGKSAAIVIGKDGVTEFGWVDDATGDFNGSDHVNRERVMKGEVTFRLVVKNSVALFYLDDELMHCASMPNKATGTIGLAGALTKVRAWQAPDK